MSPANKTNPSTSDIKPKDGGMKRKEDRTEAEDKNERRKKEGFFRPTETGNITAGRCHIPCTVFNLFSVKVFSKPGFNLKSSSLMTPIDKV